MGSANHGRVRVCTAFLNLYDPGDSYRRPENWFFAVPVAPRFYDGRAGIQNEPEFHSERWYRPEPAVAELLDGNSPANLVLRFCCYVGTVCFCHCWALERRIQGMAEASFPVGFIRGYD